MSVLSRYIQTIAQAYPSNPRTRVCSECQLPRRLQRLEILIWLKEGTDGQDIEEPERQEEE